MRAIRYWMMHLSVKVLLGLLLVAFGAGAFVGPNFSFTGLVSGSQPVPSGVEFSGIQAAFCPSPACVTLTASAIDNANERIWVAMYSFTNTDLRDALIRAKNRGVDVKMIVEKQQAGGQYSQHDELAAAGIPVRIDTNPNLMHDKFAVLDHGMVITGSMNWTGNGVSENNENVNVISSPSLNAQYENEFTKVWNESMPYSEN